MKSLFDKTELKNKELKNRVFRSATYLNLAKDTGEINSEIISVYREYAKGQIGGIITGIATVHPEDEKVDGMLEFHNDTLAAKHIELTEAVHEEGSLIFLQIGIVDLHTHGLETVTNIPKEEINKLTDLFKDAAIRAENAGYDGVQIHAAHFLFLSKFISPLYNNRSDEYGQNSNSKILIDILGKIKSVVSEDFIISIKINCSDFMEGGLMEEDFISICKVLNENGMDLFEVSGNSPSRPIIQDASNEAYFKDSGVKLKNEIDAPIILTGGHRSIENMERILNETDIEYLGISRPFLYEPHLIRRWSNNNLKPSKCISYNFCYKTPGHDCVYKFG